MSAKKKTTMDKKVYLAYNSTKGVPMVSAFTADFMRRVQKALARRRKKQAKEKAHWSSNQHWELQTKLRENGPQIKRN